MDQAIRWATEIPPVTRYWSLSIIITAVLTSIGLCSLNQFMFSIERAFGRQPWLLVTSFCYYGSLSIELVLSVFFLMRLSRYLEESYQTSKSLFPIKKVRQLSPGQWREMTKWIDSLKTLDYLYFIFLVCASIVAVVTIGWHKRYFTVWKLGPILNDAILYIWCKNNPDVVVNLMGVLGVTSAYLPWVYTIIDVLFLLEFQKDVYDLFSGRRGSHLERFLLFFQKVATQPYFWKVLIRYGVGHFWWFLGNFSPQLFYNDQNDERRKVQEKEGSRRREQRLLWESKRFNIVQYISGLIMLPPWYRFLISKVSRMEFPEDQEGTEDENDALVQDVEVDIEDEDQVQDVEPTEIVDQVQDDLEVAAENEDQVQDAEVDIEEEDQDV